MIMVAYEMIIGQVKKLADSVLNISMDDVNHPGIVE